MPKQIYNNQGEHIATAYSSREVGLGMFVVLLMLGIPILIVFAGAYLGTSVYFGNISPALGACAGPALFFLLTALPRLVRQTPPEKRNWRWWVGLYVVYGALGGITLGALLSLLGVHLPTK